MPGKIPNKLLRALLDRMKARIKHHPIVQKMFDDYDVDINELDLIPMTFSDVGVSGRTDHGIIYFNPALLADGFENDDHYMIHEIVHFLQQTCGTKPTQSSNADNYLDNKDEIEGFQNQTQYIADTQSQEKAEEYVDKLLDHHEIKSKKERNERKKELLKFVGD